MNDDTENMFLNESLLVAMPSMGDGRFAQSVIFLWTHDADGAMGLMLNKPMKDMHLSDIVSQVGIKDMPTERDIDVHVGGPVERQRGFLLHSTDYDGPDTQQSTSGAFALTATIDALKDIGHGKGPDHALLALGYSGWGAGQLEHELQENAWLIVPATPELVFSSDKAALWQMAVGALGFDPNLLSATGGQA